MMHHRIHRIFSTKPSYTPHQRTNRWAGMLLFLIGLSLSVVPVSQSAFADGTMRPFERAMSTPKGMLESPYRNNPASVAEEGLELYRALDCSGCHGGGGGGGMAVPLTNPVWIYGNDDDTLFRVITLGTGSLSPGDAFQNQGYKRKGSEAVVGPMPHYGDIIKRDDEVWKIIAWIRSTSLSDD